MIAEFLPHRVKSDLSPKRESMGRVSNVDALSVMRLLMLA
jgi:hypothetical protein